MDTSKDSQGVQRGACSKCECDEYIRPAKGQECDYCEHKPVAHENLTSPATSPSHTCQSNNNNNNNTSLPICPYPGCTNPVRVENGKVLGFCRRSHIIPPPAPTPTPTPTPNLPACPYPGCTNRVRVENGKVLGFCRRSHIIPPPAPTPTPTPNLPTCPHPGCTNPVRVENGKVLGFCRRSHAPQPTPSPQTPGLTLLQSTDPKYQEIETQFIQKWLHPKNNPIIHSIAIIHCDSTLMGKFDAYRSAIIQKRPEFKYKGYKEGGPGNEHRRFHGTNSMKCNLGLNNNSSLCNNTDCATCNIIRVGFQLHYKSKWGRFGQGIYLTSTSSKSDDYNAGTSSGLGSGIKAMFVCKVIVGNGKKLTQDDSNLTAAPPGFDSVLGETGGSLNYDEVIVYNEDAVIPAYLIIYQ